MAIAAHHSPRTSRKAAPQPGCLRLSPLRLLLRLNAAARTRLTHAESVRQHGSGASGNTETDDFARLPPGAPDAECSSRHLNLELTIGVRGPREAISR